MKGGRPRPRETLGMDDEQATAQAELDLLASDEVLDALVRWYAKPPVGA